MITIKLYCGQCESEKEVQFDGAKMPTKTINLIKEAALAKQTGGYSRRQLTGDKWVWYVQQNGPNIDTYCSKECAK